MRTRPHASSSGAPRRPGSEYSSLLVIPGALLTGVGLLLMASIVYFFLIGVVFALVGIPLFGVGLWLTWISGAPGAVKVAATLLPLAAAVAVGTFIAS